MCGGGGGGEMREKPVIRVGAIYLEPCIRVIFIVLCKLI